MFVELVFDLFDFLGDDFLEEVFLDFLYIFLVKLVELFFLGLEGFQDLTFDNMVSFFFHLPDYHFELFNFTNLAHCVDAI